MLQLYVQLFKNVIETYTPNVKSMWARFGVAHKSSCTKSIPSDVELSRTSYIDSTTVTDFTFSGNQGEQYLECTGFGGDASKFLTQGDLVQFSDANNNVVQQLYN